jgi:hypothetical protein
LREFGWAVCKFRSFDLGAEWKRGNRGESGNEEAHLRVESCAPPNTRRLQPLRSSQVDRDGHHNTPLQNDPDLSTLN